MADPRNTLANGTRIHTRLNQNIRIGANVRAHALLLGSHAIFQRMPRLLCKRTLKASNEEEQSGEPIALKSGEYAGRNT